ncbi:MAG: hypothetical protein ABIH27_05465, partial [Candidatus Omnitrophota bacterium]
NLSGTWNQAFYLWLGYFTGSASSTTDIKDIVVDWARVRKYASTEPTISTGAEQSVISRLVITTSPQTLIQNQSSTLITVQACDSAGNAKTVSVATTIDLSSSSSGGSFAPESDPSAWSSDNTSTITISAGQSSASFYYKDSIVGTPTITASEYPSVGWTDATQQETINSAVNTFYVIASTPQVAGSSFTLTISAIDQDGAVSTEFSGTVNLAVNYVSPNSGSGTLAVTQTSDFVSGIAIINNESFSDCGTITIAATKSDDATKTGSSTNIVFLPYDFTVVPDALTQTTNKAFGLKVTARNAQGTTCPNYKGTANLSAVYVSPSTDQSASISPSSLGSADFSNGLASLTTAKYNKWGTVKIKATDSLSAERTGQSQEIKFNPKDFTITLSTPPKSRTFYYQNEQLIATVTARDNDNNTIANYQGTIQLSSSDRSQSLTHTILSADAGVHNFLFSFASGGKIKINVIDQDATAVKGESSEFTVKEVKIKIFSTSGPVGSVPVTVRILDSQDNLVTEDDSTSFTITFTEATPNDSASSDATSIAVTIKGGAATIYITDQQAEVVTITPASSPVLTSVAGTVTFGSFKGRDIGIDMWREIR